MPDFNLVPAGLSAAPDAFLNVQDLDVPPADVRQSGGKTLLQPEASDVRAGVAGTRSTKVPPQLGRSDARPLSTNARDLAGAQSAQLPMSGKLTLEAFGNPNGVGLGVVAEVVKPLSKNDKLVLQVRQRGLDPSGAGLPSSTTTRVRAMFQHSIKTGKGGDLVLGAGVFGSGRFVEGGPPSFSFGPRVTASLSQKFDKHWSAGVNLELEGGPTVVSGKATTNSLYFEGDGYLKYTVNPKSASSASLRVGVAGFNRFQPGQDPNAAAAYFSGDIPLAKNLSLVPRVSLTLEGTGGTGPDPTWGKNPGDVTVGASLNWRF